jgi:stage V sporulation protein G
MKIVRMNLLDNSSGSKLLAFFDIETDDGIVIKNLRLLTGVNGLFTTPPNEKGKDDKYYDTIIFPKNIKDAVEKAAIEEYNKLKQ